MSSRGFCGDGEELALLSQSGGNSGFHLRRGILMEMKYLSGFSDKSLVAYEKCVLCFHVGRGIHTEDKINAWGKDRIGVHVERRGNGLGNMAFGCTGVHHR